jgi:hypothetical protein
MTSKTVVHKYNIYCTTESAWVSTWAETEPTVCPNNNGHTINSGSISIVETVESSEVKIQEEATPTGGSFRCDTVSFDATASTTTTFDYSWPIPVGILSVAFHPLGAQKPDGTWDADESQEGDTFSICIAPDTTIGAITANVAASATIIDVQQSVIDNIKIGYYVKLTDGTNTDDCGRVLSIDSVNLKITVETATTNAFEAATPTYVQMTVYMIKDFEIGYLGRYSIGDDKIGASHLTANTVARVNYVNNTAAQKRVRFLVEYLY